MRLKQLAGFALAIFVMSVACQQGGSTPANSNDTLIIGIPNTPPSIDLDSTSGPQTWLIAGQTLARGLQYQRIAYPYQPVASADPTQIPGFTYPNFDLQTLQPGILSSCDLSSDGLTATYNLRHGVKSAVGNEFTSADVLWNVQRALELKGNGAFFIGLANAGNINQWSAVDTYTVKITSSTPMPTVCAYNAHLFWKYLDSTEAKKHTASDDPWATKWEATNGAGFGPYQITAWEAGKQIVMQANPNYYAGAPKIKKIIWQVVPDSAGRLELLQAGKIDIAESLAAEEALSLAGKSGVRIAGERSPQGLFVVMNNSKPPFNKVKVRQAVNMAVNRSDIVTNIFHGLANNWQGPTPSVFTGTGYSDRHAYDYNPTKAKQLLAEAGYANGFTTTVSYSATDAVQEQVAILMQNSLKQIGVTLTLQKLPSAAVQTLVTGSKADFALWIDAAFMPEPSFVSAIFFYPNLGNFENYNDPAVFVATDKGKPLIGLSQRATYYGQVQDTIYQDAPLLWVAEPYFVAAMRTRVNGYGLDCFPFYDVFRMSLS